MICLAYLPILVQSARPNVVEFIIKLRTKKSHTGFAIAFVWPRACRGCFSAVDSDFDRVWATDSENVQRPR